MNIGTLKDLVTEALGEDVMNFDQILAGIRAGCGDLISRGYRDFASVMLYPATAKLTTYEELMAIRKEINNKPAFSIQSESMAIGDFPSDCLEILFVRIFIGNRSYVATKLALANPNVQAIRGNSDDDFYTDFNALGYDNPPYAVYYKKGKVLYFEWNRSKGLGTPTRFEIGYNRNIPVISESYYRNLKGLTKDQTLDLTEEELPLAEDYCNVLVNFMIWYVASANGREQEQLSVLKNEYKYSVEDLLARKAKEDQYDSSTEVVRSD